MAGRRRGYFHGHSAGREPLTAYEVNEHVAALAESKLSLSSYCRDKPFDRRTLAEGIKEHRPDAAELIGPEPVGRQSGAKLETSAKGMLERRGYYVVKSYASKSALDLLAVGKEKPTLMVQAKKDGRIGSAEWNALFDLAELHGCWPVLVQRDAEGKGAIWSRLVRRREFREGQKGLLEEFDPRNPYQPALAVA